MKDLSSGYCTLCEDCSTYHILHLRRLDPFGDKNPESLVELRCDFRVRLDFQSSHDTQRFTTISPMKFLGCFVSQDFSFFASSACADLTENSWDKFVVFRQTQLRPCFQVCKNERSLGDTVCAATLAVSAVEVFPLPIGDWRRPLPTNLLCDEVFQNLDDDNIRCLPFPFSLSTVKEFRRSATFVSAHGAADCPQAQNSKSKLSSGRVDAASSVSELTCGWNLHRVAGGRHAEVRSVVLVVQVGLITCAVEWR